MEQAWFCDIPSYRANMLITPCTTKNIINGTSILYVTMHLTLQYSLPAGFNTCCWDELLWGLEEAAVYKRRTNKFTIQVHTHMHMSHVYMHVYTQTHMHIHTSHTHAHTHTHHIHTHTHTHQTNTYTYIFTTTHKFPPWFDNWIWGPSPLHAE